MNLEYMLFTSGYLSAGVILGVLVLPWRHRISQKDNTTWFLVAFAIAWPYLAVYGALEGIKAYRKSWWDYSDRKRTAKHRQ